MRYLRLLIIFIALCTHLAPAVADGCYVPKLDKGSYAHDISEPSQKAIICHFGNKERLVLQVSYKGDVKEFCWLVPTPSRPKVNVVKEPVFHALHSVTAPESEYWLDARKSLQRGLGVMRHKGITSPATQVELLEQKTVGSYDVVVLNAHSSRDLVNWLRAHGYSVTDRYKPVFDHYIKRGWVFTAAKITAPRMETAASKLEEGILAPLQFDFSTDRPVYPLRISSLNPGRTNILLYYLGDKKVECPGFDTVCSIGRSPNLWMRIYFFDREHVISQALYDLTHDARHRELIITKLSADMSAAKMTGDLFLSPAKSQDEILPKPVPAPFVENLGAVSLLMFCYLFMMPYNLLMFFPALIVSFFVKSKRLQQWLLVIAAIAFFGPVPVSIAAAGMDSPQYVVIGWLILGVPLLAIVCMAITWSRRHRKARMIA